jgi:hypothetical protein
LSSTSWGSKQPALGHTRARLRSPTSWRAARIRRRPPGRPLRCQDRRSRWRHGPR